MNISKYFKLNNFTLKHDKIHILCYRDILAISKNNQGFIARKGSSDNYEGWWASHRELVAKENWSRKANAFYWESGKAFNFAITQNREFNLRHLTFFFLQRKFI